MGGGRLEQGQHLVACTAHGVEEFAFELVRGNIQGLPEHRTHRSVG
jgi:hypothetical protein